MLKMKFLVVTTAALMALPAMADGTDVNWDMVAKIRDEGFNRSKVMDTVQHLTDVIGPRLSGSPQMKQANDWTRDKLTEWGMQNARLEAHDFGRGWHANYTMVHMVTPREVQLQAYPVSWHPGTNGVVEGEVMRVTINNEKDMEKYKGKLKGKILMVSDARTINDRDPNNEFFRRLDEEALKARSEYRVPAGPTRSFNVKARLKRMQFQEQLAQFYLDEGALAMVRSSRRGAMFSDASGYSYQVGKTPSLPAVSLAREHYNRLDRLMKAGERVSLRMDVSVTFSDDDTNIYNTLADLPGKTDEVVMIGAHLDSWHLGDGAVDNAAGSAVAMEAMRILSALDYQPKRTIRIGLWSGEEQGLIGARQHVAQHYADRPVSDDPDLADAPISWRKSNQWPITTTDQHGKFSAYYNLDNGSGKIRGIYAQGNSAAAPIFAKWLEPFHDLGAETVTLNNTGGTDHLAFDAVGLPGFQFIQDPLDYSSRLHHTQLDMMDHIYEKDLKQASVIMASFLYHTSEMDGLLPRKAMPQPEVGDK